MDRNGVVRILDMVLILIWMTCFGLMIDVKSLAAAFKSKALLYGLFIGIFIMPAWGSFIIFAFRLRGNVALAFLLVGCTPGGAISNVWAVIAGSDLSLSAAVTTVNTFVSAGTLVLWMYLYGKLIKGDSGSLHDYKAFEIVKTAFAVVAGITLGLLIKSKRGCSTGSLKVIKVVATVVGVVLVFGSIAFTFATGDMHHLELPHQLYFACIVRNLTALAAGVGGGHLLKLSKAEMVTLGFEVSTQNIGIPFLIVTNCFTGSVRSNMTVVILIFGASSLIQNVCFTIFVKLAKWTAPETIFEDDTHTLIPTDAGARVSVQTP